MHHTHTYADPDTATERLRPQQNTPMRPNHQKRRPPTSQPSAQGSKHPGRPNSSQRFIPEATQAARTLQEEVEALDRIITELRFCLNGLQPPRSGKLGLEWRLDQGHTAPVPVVWRRALSGGHWRYDEVGRKHLSLRVKTSHAFHDLSKTTKQVARLVQALLEQRADLLRSLSNFTQSATMKVRASSARRAGWQRELDRIQPQARAALVAWKAKKGTWGDDE